MFAMDSVLRGAVYFAKTHSGVETLTLTVSSTGPDWFSIGSTF